MVRWGGGASNVNNAIGQEWEGARAAKEATVASKQEETP